MTNDTVELFWAMPDGGTEANVTWPQTLADPANLTCGVTYQVDTYIPDEAAIFSADGVLYQGEDYGSATQQGALQWRFVYGGDCAPPATETPVPPTEVATPPVDTYVPEPVIPNTVPMEASVVVPVDTTPMLAETGVDFGPLIFASAVTLVFLGVLAWSFGRDRRGRK